MNLLVIRDERVIKESYLRVNVEIFKDISRPATLSFITYVKIDALSVWLDVFAVSRLEITRIRQNV